MGYCRKCGNELLVDYARFCNNCGAEVVKVADNFQPKEIVKEEIIEVKDEKMESKASDATVISLVLTTIGISVLLIFGISLVLV